MFSTTDCLKGFHVSSHWLLVFKREIEIEISLKSLGFNLQHEISINQLVHSLSIPIVPDQP